MIILKCTECGSHDLTLNCSTDIKCLNCGYKDYSSSFPLSERELSVGKVQIVKSVRYSGYKIIGEIDTFTTEIGHNLEECLCADVDDILVALNLK